MNPILGKTQCLFAALLFTAAPACLAQGVLASYSMTSATPFSQTYEAPGVTAGDLGGAYVWYWKAVQNGVGGSTYPGLQVNPGATATSPALAAPPAWNPSLGFYETFTITSTTPMNLSSLTFNAGLYTAGANGFDLSSSADGFASYLTSTPTTATLPAFGAGSFDLSAPMFQGLTSITFELSGYTPAYSYEGMTGLSLNAASVAPEPNTLALAGMDLMSLLGLKAWRRGQ